MSRAGSAGYSTTSPTGVPIWRWLSNHVRSEYSTSAAAPATSSARWPTAGQPLANRCPDADELAGIDPAPSMIKVATASSGGDRLSFSVGVAEQLPYPDGPFDLVVSSTSFDHWSDQQVGLRECARVLQPGTSRPRRSVLVLARTHSVRGPPRQGAHQAPRQPAPYYGRFPGTRLARPPRCHHQGRDRDLLIQADDGSRPSGSRPEGRVATGHFGRTKAWRPEVTHWRNSSSTSTSRTKRSSPP